MTTPKPIGRPRKVPAENFVPEVLRMLRHARGLKQRQLAERVGKSTPTASSWETGRTTPSEAEVEDIAAALECRPRDLGDASLLDVAKISTETDNRDEQ